VSKVWTWAAASCRGTSHERNGTRLQDAHACAVVLGVKPTLIATVCDGAGSASHGGQGASLACRSFTRAALGAVRESCELPTQAQVECWTDQVRDQIGVVATRRTLTARDFASTLVSVISDGDRTVISHIGDGCAVLRRQDTKEWIAPSWPEQGQYASTTFFLTDEPDLHLRVTRVDCEIDAIAVFSDGIERLVLDLAAKRPSSTYFDGVIAPILASAAVGRDAALCDHLKEYLATPAINARTDDDKTLVLAGLK
jgi:hypothetical protein